MSAKTTFWFGLVVALAVIGSTVALPLSTNDDSGTQNGKTVVLPEQPKEPATAAESVQPAGEAEDLAAVSTDASSVSQTVKTESTDDGPVSTSGDQPIENVAGSTLPAESSNGPDRSAEPVTTAAAATTAAGSNSQEPANGSDSQEPAAGVSSSEQGAQDQGAQRPKPYYADAAQSVKVGPGFPFYLEFIQPFQPFPRPANAESQNSEPLGQQQFGSVVDPFNPFPQHYPIPQFNQIIEAYTNEFRTPEVIIVKPKRNVHLNSTIMPPIPLLMNIMLNAFRRDEPPGMLESFNRNAHIIPQQMEAFDNTQSGSNKPVSKTTTKTEIINGHVVQINETTYSNGDENHKSFYHFKEIQVLPETNNKKIANEKVTSMIKDDSEKLEMNEINRQPIESIDNIPKPVNLPKLVKKNAVPGPLDEYYQTAAASHYGSLYAPAYYVPKSSYVKMPAPPPPPVLWDGLLDHHRRRPAPGHQHAAPAPPPPAISLSGDTLVNDLMAARIKASGAQYQLPADVVLVDVNELQSRPSQGAARPVRRRSPQRSTDDGRRYVQLL